MKRQKVTAGNAATLANAFGRRMESSTVRSPSRRAQTLKRAECIAERKLSQWRVEPIAAGAGLRFSRALAEVKAS